ncbi:MAG: hypothetical protein U9N49_05105 [Campylobacterota bacterium]|nr:hypothetical protein [Campylobacterota bacterium]
MDKNEIERKEAIKVVVTILSSFLLLFFLLKVGSFITSYELLPTDRLVVIVALITFIFFISEFRKTHLDIVQTLLKIIVITILFPITVLIWKMFAYDLGKYIKLYQYSGYPCENVTFEIADKMVLVTRNNSYMQNGLYYLTRNTLENYSDYKSDSYSNRDIEKKIYTTGSPFKVIGYYGATGSSLGFSQNYLVQSLEDNESVAWISHWKFNAKACCPLLQENYYEENLTFDVQLGNHNYHQKSIDISRIQMKSFE